MAKSILDAAFDAMLSYIANNCTELVVCSTEPSTYTEAHTTYKLANVTLTAGDGNGDYVIGNGDSGGRKVAVGEQAAITVDASGTAGFVCLNNVSGSAMVIKTTCTEQVLTAGNTVTVPTFDITVSDPT